MTDARVDMVVQAIRELKPLWGRLGGYDRHFCPHAVGEKAGSRYLHVFVWQFGGGSEHPETLPGWRCFRLDKLSGLRLSVDAWRKGDAIKGRPQSCVDRAFLTVSPEQTRAKLPGLVRP